MSVKQTRYDNLSNEELARDPSESRYARGIPQEHTGDGVLSGVIEKGPRARRIAAVGMVALVALGLSGKTIAERFAAVAHPQTKTELIQTQPTSSVAGGTNTEVMKVQQQVIENSGK